MTRELTQREAEVYRLTVVNQLTQQQIADRLGLSQQTVSDHLRRARENMPPVDHEAIRRQSLELHLDTMRAALELAEMEGAPVTSGKDGDVVRDPTDNSVVRDYSGRIAARKLALEADREIRKLMGLDAATKIEQSGMVRYEVAGVDLDALS